MRELKDIKYIYFLPYVHADHAWTNSRQWHIKRYVEGMRRTLDYMQVNPDYTFLIDAPLHFYDVIERFMPERLEEIRQRVREQRILIANGGMSLARPNNYGDELYLRNAAAGQNYFRTRFPEADQFMFFNADTGVGHSQMPQLLTQMGHTHYRFYRPEFALDHTGVPREFVWKGLDGSKIVATRGNYAGLQEGDCTDETLPDWEAQRKAFIDELLTEALPHMDTDVMFTHIGADDAYPQHNRVDRPSDITGLMEKWNAVEAAKITYATPAEYHKALTAQPLPEWDGVVDPVDLFYNVPTRSELSLTRLRFEAESLLLTAERLEVLLRELGGTIEEGLIASLWEQMFAYSGHAMQSLLTDDYEDMQEKAQLVRSRIRQYLRELLLRLAHAAGASQPDSYLFVNPCAFPREETVSVLITTPEHIKGLKLYDQNGDAIEYQILDGYEGDKPYVDKDFNEAEVAFTVKVPPLGYTRIHAVCDRVSVVPKAQNEVFLLAEDLDPAQTLVLDNGRYRFTIAGGQIRQVEDSQTGKIRVAEGEQFGQLRFYETYESEWSEWDRDKQHVFLPQKVRYDQRGPQQFHLSVTGTLNGREAVVEMTTKRNSPTVEYTVHLESRGEVGYFAMAFPAARDPEIVAGIPYGSERRNLDGIFYSEDHGIPKSNYLFYERSAKGGFFANRYASFLSGEGRLLLTQGQAAYLYRFLEQEGELETFFLFACHPDDNKKLWIRNGHVSRCGVGPHTFRFTASVLDRERCPARTERLVAALRHPILSTPMYETAPKAPAVLDRVAELPENLTLTALYVDGADLVLRLFENSGAPWQGQIPLNAAVRAADRCDVMGHVQDAVAVDAAGLHLSVRPWEIVTLRLRK